MSRGSKVHKEFNGLLQNGAGGRNLSGETSYLNGSFDGRYRPKGSSSPDAILGSVQRPTYKVTPSGHDVPRPTTYTGIGLGGNAIYNLAK